MLTGIEVNTLNELLSRSLQISYKNIKHYYHNWTMQIELPLNTLKTDRNCFQSLLVHAGL